MREWRAVFKHPLYDVITEIVEKGELGAEALERFDAAWRAHMYMGREVFGMWIIDRATEQEDVIRAEGRCPNGYHERHAEWKKRAKGKA